MSDQNNQRSMILRCRRLGRWSLNAYVLIDPASSQSVLVDPGAEPHTLEELLGESVPAAIVVTHGHPDHIGALETMRARLKVPVMAHRLAAGDQSGIHPDQLLNQGDTIEVGAFRLKVYHTPGHTPEQICLAIEGDQRVLVGDTIFKGGPGRTWSAADFKTTLATLRDTVLHWPDSTHCYPGHGLSFNLGEQRNAIERFLGQDHGRFYGNATWDMVPTLSPTL